MGWAIKAVVIGDKKHSTLRDTAKGAVSAYTLRTKVAKTYDNITTVDDLKQFNTILYIYA